MVEILEGVGPLAAFRRGNGVVVKVDDIRQAIFLTLSGIKAQRIGIQGIGRKIHRKPSAVVYLVKASFLTFSEKKAKRMVFRGMGVKSPRNPPVVFYLVKVPPPVGGKLGRVI